MRRRHSELARRGVEVIAVAPGTRGETDAFAASQELPFPCLADPDRRIFVAYQVESSPFSLGQRPALYAVDERGIVRYAYLGRQQWQLGDVDEALAALGK